MIVETNNLKTINNFAKEFKGKTGNSVHISYIYKLIRLGREMCNKYGFDFVEIDKQYFIFKMQDLVEPTKSTGAKIILEKD